MTDEAAEDVQYNPETGEVLEEVVDKGVYIPGVKIQANVTALARLDLTGLEYRVLFAFFANVRIKEGNIAYVNIADIAHALGKKKQSIDRIVASLRKKGLIEREKNGVWILNSRVGFRGSFWQWARVYVTAPPLDFDVNSNGLDGRKDPVEYNRSRRPVEEPADV